MKTYYLFICSIFNCYDLNFLPNKSQKRSSKFSNEIISYFTITPRLRSSYNWSSKSLGIVETRTKSQWRFKRGKNALWSQFLTVMTKFSIQMWETVGSLERECIEEDCDEQEFHEVYDNLAVSNPLLLKYDKCKQVAQLRNDCFFLTSYISVCWEKSWTQS